MLGGEVYVGFAFAKQLDRITVFIFTQLINTVTFRAKAEMIGNHTALTVIKCFVSSKQHFCLPLFEKYPFRIGGRVNRHILCRAFTVLVGVFTVKIGVVRAVNSDTDNLFGVPDTFFDCGGNYDYRFIIKFILILCIQTTGILSPLIVRPIESTEEYEVISGHRRLHAAVKAGITEVPALIYAFDRDSAAIVVVDSNLHREHILPSEKAFAYKLKMEALNHQGVTCGQVGHKSRDDVSDTESGRTVQRYIKHDKEDIPFFMCGNYHGNRGTCSSTHYLRADAIEQVVTLELRRLSKCLCDNEEDFATLLADKTNADILKEKKHIEAEMQRCIVRSEQVAELCIKCYEDNVSGKLTDEMFMRFSQKYETERSELKEKIAAYRRRLAEANEMQLGKEKFIAAVRKFMQMDRLTAPLLQELIDRIDVYEVTGTGKNRKQMIKIHYKFVGYLELPSLARQCNYREETRKGVAVEYVPNALPA